MFISIYVININIEQWRSIFLELMSLDVLAESRDNDRSGLSVYTKQTGQPDEIRLDI